MTDRRPPAFENKRRVVALQVGAAVLVCGLAAAAYFYFGVPAVLLVVMGAAASFLAGSGMLGTHAPANVRSSSSDSVAVPVSPQLSSLTEVLDSPAFILNAARDIEAYNRLALDLFPQMAAGKSLLQVSRNPDLLSSVENATSANKARSFEMIDHSMQGRRLFGTISPLRAEITGGEISASGTSNFLVQFRDLTEQDRLAQTRSDFIANASHELRTPLAAMIGFIETLRGPARRDVAAHERFLAIMAAQAARMTRILDDLLSLSRVEMRAHLAPVDDVEVASVLRAVVHSMEPLADDAKISIYLDTGAEPFHTRGDRDQLEQVFQNLVQNAIKYGREGGRVDIAIKQGRAEFAARRDIAVTVTDDGPGIAEEHLPRLTERFYRVDTATSRARGGTGLGLAIVKHILNRHHGELEIASKLGEGSRFTVILDSRPRSSLSTAKAGIPSPPARII